MSYSKFRPRRGTTQQWTEANTLLNEGEIAFEFANRIGDGEAKIKIGDGITRWNDLPYAIESGTSKEVIEALRGEIRALENTLGYITTEKNLLDDYFFTEDQTLKGVEVTVHDDRSFTLNGTATEDISVSVYCPFIEYDDPAYKLTGCPEGGSKDTYCLKWYNYNNENGHITACYDVGEGIEVTAIPTYANIYLVIKAGTTLDNKTFYPMVRYATIEDDTYEPYGLKVKTKLQELDERRGVVSAYRQAINPENSDDNRVWISFPEGFTRFNSIAIGVSYEYYEGDYTTERISRNKASIEMTDENIQVIIPGNSSSKYVDVEVILYKIK